MSHLDLLLVAKKLVCTHRDFYVLLFQLIDIFNLLPEGLSFLVLDCFGNQHVVVQKGSVLRVGENAARLVDQYFLICAASWMCVWHVKRVAKKKESGSHHGRRPRPLAAVFLHHPDQLQQFNAELLNHIMAVRINYFKMRHNDRASEGGQ